MSANTPAVSIIVPIYNVEEFLEQCLDSILAQTLEDIEVICVNDGSTDSSLSILQSYASKDVRIRVIDKPNGGYGHAVNRGIEEARGEWVGIVEPDDFIDPKMYEDLVANAALSDGGVADIVKSSFWMYYDAYDGQPARDEVPFLGEVMPGWRSVFTAAQNPDVIRQHPSIWSAIYRRRFLNEHHIRMLEVKGAGWTDNPWMIDTMLRADSIVWIPQAYYHYRQTNPGSSSNLRDYHLPFDRLRDMRAIYDELGIKDPALLSALYSRTLTYITKQILDEGGFDEADPELQSLIRESLEPIDRTVLFSRKSLISDKSKDYYRDFMGMNTAGVKTRTRRSNPAFTFVLPLKDDREGLWRTIKSLMRQTVTDFEVICVDCATRDRSAQIVGEVMAKDARFSLLHEASGDVASGFNLGLSQAKAPYVMFLRSGMELVQQTFLQRAQTCLRGWSENAPDVIACESKLSWAAESRWAVVPSETVIEANADSPSRIACMEPGVGGKLFSREFLAQGGIGFEGAGDADGHAFLKRACSQASRVALVGGAAVRDESRWDIFVKSAEKGRGCAEELIARYEALLSDDDSGLGSAFALHALAVDLPRAAGADEADAIYAKLKGFFEDKLASGCPADSSPYDCKEHQQLQAFFAGSFQEYLQNSVQSAIEQNRKAAKRIGVLEGTVGFRTERAVKGAAKKVLSQNVLTRIQSR